MLPIDEVGDAVARLAQDLGTGAWQERNRALLAMDQADVGLRIVVGDATR
jgi:hypothetical protein